MSGLRVTLIAAAAALGLAGCTGYDRGYGYGGVSIGSASGYAYGRGYPVYGPAYGWYDGYYYPGSAIMSTIAPGGPSGGTACSNAIGKDAPMHCAIARMRATFAGSAVTASRTAASSCANGATTGLLSAGVP
jgi:hypothetical protein